MNLRFCAVVVAFRNSCELQRLLGSLRESTHQLDGIIVIDNSVEKSFIEANTMIFEKFVGDVETAKFIAMQENVGSAGGYRHGMMLAHQLDFDWVWLLDQDGTVDARCLELLMPYIDKGEVLCPAVLSIDDRESLLPFRMVTNIWGTPRLPKKKPETETLPVSLFGSHGVMISKKAMEKIGYYDATNFFCGWEDYDYAQRLCNASLKTLMVYNAIVYHPDLVKKYKNGKLPLSNRLFFGMNQNFPLPVFLGCLDSAATGLSKIRRDTWITFVRKNIRGARFFAAFFFSLFCLVALRLSGRKVDFHYIIAKYIEMKKPLKQDEVDLSNDL